MKIYLKVLLLSIKSLLIFGQQTPPHIIFIYADDLGWNDVSFHGSLEIPTPNIDALAMSGILLNNYYGYNLCTPSRAALLTGKNPIRLGLQHFVLRVGEASGIPLEEVLLPQHLKRLGYTNHLIGKWHLGHMSKEYTPSYRGFDSFFGYWSGNMDYFDHIKLGETGLEEIPHFYGIDLHNGTDIARNFRGQYATELFSEVAEGIIGQHDTSTPLFLYLAHMAPHTGSNFKPLQAPPKYVTRMKHIKDRNKRIYAAMISALDDSIGQIFKALYERDMLENSIIVFASDNGGETRQRIGGYGSNFPLRGRKYTLWEGGNRLPALIWSPLFKLQEPRISMQMMHVTDWLPTFYKAAGGDVQDLGDIDGIDMWEALTTKTPSPRNHILYNIDPVSGTSALRVGDMKLINGSIGADDWYNSSSSDYSDLEFPKLECENINTVRNLLSESGKWIVENPDEWRKRAALICSQPPPKPGNCNAYEKPCLFDIFQDPCEYNNIADQFPEEVDKLMKIIEDYQKTAVKPQSKPSDVGANPDCHNFEYVTWLDPEHYDKCDEYL